MSCPKNYVNKSDMEPGGGTMGDAKIGGKWQRYPSIPLLPQRNAGPWDKYLSVHSKMTRIHYVRVAPP